MNLQSSAILNRSKLQALLEPNAVAVIHCNDVYPGNEDGTLPYCPHADLYYLTGIIQEESALLLFPDHPDPALREVLFVRTVDETFVKWHGRRLSLEEASEISGIQQVDSIENFDAFLMSCMNYAGKIYLNTIEHPRSENTAVTREMRLNSAIMSKYPLHEIRRLAPLLGHLRSSKNEFEIEMLSKACQISGKGFRRLLSSLRPGMTGKQVMAELIHEYLQHGGDWAHYEPIAAAGANTCILHYISNTNTCQDGDLLLVDAAASYRQYNADLTRVIPVNGRYSQDQRNIYNEVLRIHKTLKTSIRSGMMIRDVQQLCTDLCMEALINLKLCSAYEIANKGKAHFMNEYAYHNFGHYLGLGVHDAGNIHEPIPENAVITIEPGIYIREKGIGVRIENNVLVKSNTCIDLMADIPIEAEEIEDLMNA